MDRSPAELPAEVPVRLRFGGVLVRDRRSGEEIRLEGAVDYAAWDSCVFQLTDPRTQESKLVPGLCLLVSEVDGVPVERRLNLVARRLISFMRPYLESGQYRELRFTITKRGTGVRATFDVFPEPV